MARLFPCALLAALSTLAAPLSVRDFGAKGDGVAKDTAAIQRAIDAAEKQGGGTVTLPPGRYLSGTIRLKSNVTLHLDNGTVLLASPDNSDFDPYEPLPFKSVSDNETTYFRYGLITAENVHNIAIEGQGVIDGNRQKRGGPKTVSIKLCQFVSIRGVTVRNSPNYSISFWGTDHIDVDGVTILNGFADGIDPDASRYVRISNCYIDCHDDAICPKASPSMGMENRRSTEHLTVTNCVLRTSCNNFKFGTESSGDLKDVTVSNITMLPRAGAARPPISGISLESVDGAAIDGVVISNITMTGVRAPLFIRLGNRGRGMNPPVPGSIRNVLISNVVARGASVTSSITGIPGHLVERVVLSNLILSMAGGEAQKPVNIPEHESKYPEATMFGILPAHGLFVRHASDLTLSGVKIYVEKPDARPPLVFEGVRGLKQVQ